MSEDPRTVATWVQADADSPMDPDVLHETLWDALWNQYDFETDLPEWSPVLRQYLAVWTVRNYVGNGGLDAPLDVMPLLLPAAQAGYTAIGRPAAAAAVGQMIKARDYLMEHEASGDGEPDYDRLDEILAPGGEAPDWDEFDAGEELASYVRVNRADFLAYDFPL